jgi:hypothetical protein
MTWARGAVVGILLSCLGFVGAADTRPAGTTGTIRGVVLDDLGQPVERARVGAGTVGQRGRLVQTTTSGSAGHFELRNLPAATYTLAFSKSGHAATMFGQSVPNGPATRVPLAAGQARDIQVRLRRSGVITGVVRGPDGDPQPGAYINAMHRIDQPYLPQQMGSYTNANSNGVFRLFSLSPGRYLLRANPPYGPGAPIRTVAGSVALVSSFYPGVTDASQAQEIRVGPGEVVSGIDLHVRTVPAGSVTVDLANTSPQTDPYVTLQWRPTGHRSASAPMDWRRVLREASGRFVLRGVPAGSYVVAGSARDHSSRRAPPLWAFAEIVTSAADDGTTLTFQPGGSVTGRFVFVGDSAPPDLSTVTPGLTAVSGPFGGWGHAGSRRSVPGGFEAWNMPPANYRLRLDRLPPPWTTISATADGYDLLDDALPIHFGSVIDSLVVTLADRQTELSGTTLHTDGTRRFDLSVVVFPVDPSRRTPRSRWIRLLQPDIDGRYEVSGLPPGEFLVTAAPIDWDPALEPDRLALLEPTAQLVELHLGQPATLDIVR